MQSAAFTLESITPAEIEQEELRRFVAAQRAKVRETISEQAARPIVGRSVDTTGDLFDQEETEAPLFAAPTPKRA